MMTRTKAILATLAGALALGGCASDPYYDGYNGVGYGAGVGYGYGYGYYDNSYPGYYYNGRYYDRRGDARYDDRDRWHERDRSRARDDPNPGRIENVPQPGVDYTNEYERQNIENRERLLQGQRPSGSGG